MTMQDNNVEEIEMTIEQAKMAIKDKEQLKSLLKNKAFKRIIMKLYLEEEAIRLVHMKSVPMAPESKENIDNLMYGIGGLQRFMQRVIDLGNEMEQSLSDNEEYLEELRRGDE